MSRRFSALSFRLGHASPHARFRLWLAGAVIVGVALRLYQITDQIIADDEWHAIHAAMSRSYLYLLSHFGPADYCIPLAVYTKLAMQTVGVSEMILRAPVLLAGIASLLAFPLIILEWRGPRIGAIAAWLLAISPIHIYYSRYARPYAISLLLVVLAWAAFRRWHQGKRSRSKLVYAACSATSAYFHLIFLPAALAPLLWGFAEAILKGAKRERYDLRELALLTLGTALACLALLGLPLALGGGELLAKAGKDRIDWYTVTGTAELLIGSGNGWTVCLALVGILAGAIALVRADRSLGACFAVIAGIQCLAIAVVHPNIVRKPIVLTRYGLALLPILLVLLASAIGAAEESIRSRWPRYPFGALAAAVVGMLLVTGPLPAINYYPNAWTNHGLFQYSYAFNPYARYDRLQPGHMSPFYDRSIRDTIAKA